MNPEPKTGRTLEEIAREAAREIIVHVDCGHLETTNCERIILSALREAQPSEDTERLDWLDKRYAFLQGKFYRLTKAEQKEARSIRKEIDAARGKWKVRDSGSLTNAQDQPSAETGSGRCDDCNQKEGCLPEHRYCWQCGKTI